MKVKSQKTIFRPEYKILIEKLIKARKDSKLTQKEIADKLGWRQDYISKIESIQRRIDVIELIDLAKILNKKIEFFISHIK